MAKTTFLLTCLCVALSTAAFADTDTPSPKVQLGVAYQLIISSNADLIALAGPGPLSSIGAPSDYAIGGWKFDLGYDLAPNYLGAIGFETINGKSLSYTDSDGNAKLLNTDALGIFLEGKRVFKIVSGFESSVWADAGYYWLNNSSLVGATGGGGPLSGSAPGFFLGVGVKFFFDKADNLGLGIDFGYQYLKISPATTTGNLTNYDGSQATFDMSGFSVMIDPVEVSFDIAPPQEKKMEVPPQGEQAAPASTDTTK